MTDLGALLSKDVAGHPLGLWVGAAAAGVGLAVVVNRRRASGGATADDVGADGTVGGVPALAGSKGAVALGAPGTNVGGATVADNDSWLSAAFSYLVSHGTDALTADTALRKALAGEALTSNEASALRIALASFGPPPGGMSPVVVLPDPNTSPILIPDNAPPPPASSGGDPFAGYQQVQLHTTTGGTIFVPNVSGDIAVEGTHYDLDNPTGIPPLNPIVVENLKPGEAPPALAGPVTVSAPPGPSNAGLTWYPQLGLWI